MTYTDMRRAVAAAIFEYEQGEPFGEATGVAETHSLQLADEAIRAMDRTDAMGLLREIVPLLDGALDALGEAAKDEARRYAHQPIRQVTCMKRYHAAQELVDRGYRILGLGVNAE